MLRQSVTKYPVRLRLQHNPPPPSTRSNIEMADGGLHVIFAIVYKNNFPI
jgi:hypothetical protein